jgi:superfamily I DNA/RNA helicase
MIVDFNAYLSNHGLPVDEDSAILSSTTTRKGTLRTKILLSSSNKVSKISQIVEELVKNKKADYTDIAVIYPAKGYGRFYTPLRNIQYEFDSNGIPYSLIHGDEKRVKLFECEGVILSTIESCLGLDFKYVILCGMHYWDFIHTDDDKTEKLTKRKTILDQKAKEYVNEIGKKIYSACSRARDGLYIVDDMDPDSPIKELIRPKSGRGYYDER